MTIEQIKELNNEALLDELVEAYIQKKEYEYRSDYINWSEKAEQDAYDEYWNLYHEVLRRMEEN